MNIIKTNFQGNDQYWSIRLEADPYIYLRHCVGTVKLDYNIFNKKINEIENISNNVRIIAEPLIDKDGGINSLTNFRGHESDRNPFVFRKKNLPLLKAVSSHNYTTCKREIWYQSYYSNDNLTDGQRGFLHQNFDTQLAEFFTPELIESEKKVMLEFITDGMIKQINELENELKKFKDHVTNYKNEKLT